MRNLFHLLFIYVVITITYSEQVTYTSEVYSAIKFVNKWHDNINKDQNVQISFEDIPWYINRQYRHTVEGGKTDVEVLTSMLRCNGVPCWCFWNQTDYHIQVGANNISVDEFVNTIRWDYKFAKDLNKLLGGEGQPHIDWHHRQRHPKIIFKVHQADVSKRPPLANYNIKLSDKKI